MSDALTNNKLSVKHEPAIGIAKRYVDWRLPAASQPNAWHTQIVYTELILLMMSSKPTRNYYLNKLTENSAPCWFMLHGYVTMHGQQNIKNHSCV